MSSPPPPIPYSSGRATEDGGRIDAWTLASAACLIFLLWCLYSAFWQFYSDEPGLYFWIDRGLIALDFDKSNARTNTLTAFPTSRISASYGSGDFLDYSSVNEIPFAIGFGIFISASLFQWRVANVRWLAGMVPIAAGIWRIMMLVAKSIAERSATGPTFSPGTPATTGLATMTIGILAVVMFLQGFLAFFAAMWGRQLAAWMAGALLPRSLSRTLIGIWSSS